MFNFQPTLEANGIMVRPITELDFDDMFLAASDPLIWAGMPAKQRYKKENFEGFFSFLLDTKKAFAIVDVTKNKIIGSTRYYLTDKNQLSMGSTFLTREYWGGSTNLAFRSLLLDHAFQYFKEVFIHISQDNERNHKATSKLGFTYVYDEELPLGRGVTRLDRCYRITKQEWLNDAGMTTIVNFLVDTNQAQPGLVRKQVEKESRYG